MLELCFHNVIDTIILHSTDISKTERKYGRLQCKSIIDKIEYDQTIDVLLTPGMEVQVRGSTRKIKEKDIKERRRFLYRELSEQDHKKGIMRVHKDFYKRMEDGDRIVILLYIG